MARMTGADVDDLERGAAALESSGLQIGGMRKPLRLQLQTSPWNGQAAERFRRDWDVVHGPALSDADQFLRDAGRRLRMEADQQRRAAASGAGGRGASAGPAHQGDGECKPLDTLDEIRRLLEAIGLPISVIRDLLEKLQWIAELEDIADVELLIGPLRFLAENQALADIIGAAGTGLRLTSLAVDFVTTLAENQHLPVDEQVVLAAAVVGISIAVKAGIGAGSQFLGGAIGSMIAPGAGTLAGKVVGKLVGQLIGAGVDAVDDRFGLTDQAAEQILETYRYAKERDFDPARIAMDAAGDVADAVVDNAVDFAGDILDRGRDGVSALLRL